MPNLAFLCIQQHKFLIGLTGCLRGELSAGCTTQIVCIELQIPDSKAIENSRATAKGKTRDFLLL